MAAIISVVLLPPVIGMLRDSGAVKVNYRQKEVVNMAGILIILVWVLLMAVAAIVPMVADVLGIFIPEGFVVSSDVAMPITVLIFGAGFFGLIDDLLGNREQSGFKGHIGSLLKGKLTTGGLKAIGIPVVAIFASSMISAGVIEIIGNAILIALFVNTLNLLDLRPGRALKVYIPLQLFFIYAAGSVLGSSSAALAGIALVLIASDLKEEIMLGDTGSNILGGVLGFSLVTTYGWNVKLPVIIILVLLQVLTEKYSITAVIDRVPILRAFDNFGRRAE